MWTLILVFVKEFGSSNVDRGIVRSAAHDFARYGEL